MCVYGYVYTVEKTKMFLLRIAKTAHASLRLQILTALLIPLRIPKFVFQLWNLLPILYDSERDL